LEDLLMRATLSKRPAFVLGLGLAAFAAGVASGTWLTPREAHAQSFTSSIQVPPDGLTFRSTEGRPIARLSYDARGGVFEVLDYRGEAVSTMGVRGTEVARPAAGPRSGWSLDDVPDPWTPAGSTGHRPLPASGL
jgi:hypothetical protein